MKISKKLTIEFNKNEVVEILEKHLTKKGYKLINSLSKIKDISVDIDDRFPTSHQYEFMGFEFEVEEIKSNDKKLRSNIGGDA